MLKTKEVGLTAEQKKIKLAELKRFHQTKFDVLGVKDPLFIPKMAYKPTGKDDKVVSFFPSELKKGQDIYTEFVSREYDPEDLPERRLWKWRYNPYWETEYETVQHDAQGNVRYLIPVLELFPVGQNIISAETAQMKMFDNLVDSTDGVNAPITEMTILDFAAIMLKQPVSSKEWLNNIIRGK